MKNIQNDLKISELLFEIFPINNAFLKYDNFFMAKNILTTQLSDHIVFELETRLNFIFNEIYTYNL